MRNLESLYEDRPFSWSKDKKENYYLDFLSQLTKHHYDGCPSYKKLLDGIGYSVNCKASTLKDFPPLPVRLFKEFDLKSVPEKNIIKSMTSSGTSGNNLSRIYLDKETATSQTKVLTKITSQFLGTKRLPMLVIDSKASVKDRQTFSARRAGIIGFTILGKDITYALNDDMQLDMPAIESFLQKHDNSDLLIFGFTSIIWEHLHQSLCNISKKLDLSRGVLIHGGGWKKLVDQAVTNDAFKEHLFTSTGLKKIFNYYGMVEQTGSIFMESTCGYLHCSNYSDIILRRPDFSLCELGEAGIIELISLLPYSYPGHILLSEDVGVLMGEDNCSCGLKGKYFKVQGRLKNAEVRGCSDTYKSSP